MHETLLTKEEYAKAVDLGKFYQIPSDKGNLNYDKSTEEKVVNSNCFIEFNSNNTEFLSVDQVKEKLLSLEYIKYNLNN